jgi:release factor glutamine methyltransferase
MPDLSTIAAALAWARLARGEAGTPSLDAQVLLAHHLRLPRTHVLAHPDWPLEAQAAQAFAQDVARLIAGEPLAYLLGVREFYGLTFEVSPQVLIPRPETELLIDEARSWLGKQAPGGAPRVLDVGCGSGCIAVALAVHTPGLHLLAADISPGALSVAQRNARRHGVADRIQFVEADLLSPFAPGLDLICANPPYIASDALTRLEVSRFEPRGALDGGPDGMDPTRRLIDQAKRRMNPGSCLLIEIEESRGMAARDMAERAFPRGRIAVLEDLGGRSRLLRILVE